MPTIWQSERGMVELAHGEPIAHDREATRVRVGPEVGAALMAAARQQRSPLRAATFETLVGLLAVSGLRIGEALRLDRGDVDLDIGVLRVRQTKFGKPARCRCTQHRRGAGCLCPPRQALPAAACFVSTAGTRLLYCNAHLAWVELVPASRLARHDAAPVRHEGV